MGVKRLGDNAAALIAAGRDADEPAAAVERGTMEGQRTVVATLGTLAEAVEREGVGAPALIVVGPVVERREALAWLERRPLHGRRVVVTRARAQASGLAATLRALGAEVVELPAIRIEPRIESDEVRRAVERIGDYALICVTSPNGAQLLFEALAAAGLDARALGGGTKNEQVGQRPRAAIAAIGPGTARALAEHGIAADIVPERFVAEALGRGAGGGRGRGQARSSSPAPPRPATSFPTRCASAAPRSTSSPSTRRCARTPSPRRSRPRKPPTTSPSPPPRPCAT